MYSALTSAYIPHQVRYSNVCVVRDEEAAGLNPATPDQVKSGAVSPEPQPYSASRSGRVTVSSRMPVPSSGLVTETGLVGLWTARRRPGTPPRFRLRKALPVLDALGISEAFVLGTSQGGWVAARMAMLAPGTVKGIMPLGTSMDFESQRSRDLGCWDGISFCTPTIDALATERRHLDHYYCSLRQCARRSVAWAAFQIACCRAGPKGFTFPG